jgi:site-specific recombinase XerD
MQTKISILFYAKKAKATTEGLVPIYQRVTVDGQRIELSTKRYVDATKWSSEAGKLKGNSEEARGLNSYLDILKAKVYDYQKELIHETGYVTFEAMKNKTLGVQERALTIVPVFQDHNQKMKSLIGNEFSPNTLKRYVTTLKHLITFLKWKFNTTDIEIKSIDNAFVNEFEFYLRSVCNIQNNSAVKYVRNSFGKIIRTCIINGWLSKDPFKQYTSKVREVNRVYLTEDELDILSTKDFKNERLNQVRDIFVFSCYTGLAYIDSANLTPHNIAIGMDGEKWIYTFRQKTDSRTNIPILPPVMVIIEKYKEHPICIVKNKLLPILSNQKMNAYLKEIATLCNINKELTFHIARHTFATTVTLSNGIPIETVSKMLGHSSIKQTQHYAKILDRKVSEDMRILREKFSIKQSNQKKIAGI